MSYLFDGINHPSAATVIAAGASGCLMYGGTPGDGLGKDFIAGQYADYKAHGLLCAFVYEATANDMAGGFNAGAAHARSLLADLHAKGVSSTEPVGATVDEHVSAGNIPLAVQYQKGFWSATKASGWTGPVGVYGFAEVLIACHNAGIADWYWGAGTRSLLPSYTNVWQDNTGTIQVGGSADDRDWILIPLTPGGDMSFDLTTPLPDPLSVAGNGTVEEALATALYGIGGKRNGGALANAVASMQTSTAAALTALTAAIVAVDSDVRVAATQEATDHAANLTAISKVAALDPAVLETGIQSALTALGWTPPPSVKDIAVADAAAVAPAVLALIASKLGGAA
jgi:hypothetical protein